MNNQIISLSATALAKGIQSKKFSSEEVISAHIQQIQKVNPKLNAIIQFDFDNALWQAKQADQLLQKGKIIGPLHGVPFTVKDVLETKDFFTTSGMSERATFNAAKDATVVARMRHAGAILIGKTNMPTGGAGIGSTNPVFGCTNNPYDLTRTPGGSSSGEAAIIAAGGSPIGLGSDSGGSIRLPAHFCGIAALKPTTGRIPSTGHYPKIGDATDPRSQIGALSRHVEDLDLIFKIIAGGDGIDPYVIDMPFLTTNQSEVNKFHLAYYLNSGKITPDNDTISVINVLIEKLKQKNIDLIHHEPPHLDEVLPISIAYWDAFKKTIPVKDYFNLLEKWDDFKSDMLQFIQQYDAIITPVSISCAPLHNQLKVEDIPYTLTYSLVGWPCVVVRAGTAQNGLPINVQVIAKPFREDIALAVAKQVEIVTGGWQAPNK